MSPGIRRLAGALAAVVLILLGSPGSVSAEPLPQATSCSGVWVVVDYGSLGGTSTRCAASFGSGSSALTSAGFSIERKTGMICRIGGQPGTCTIAMTAYWSYWHAKRKSDGSYGSWTYSTLGADSYHPAAGDAEGWRFGDGKSAPGVRPPQAPTKSATTPHRTTGTSPTPAATRTTAKARTTTTSKPATPGTTGAVTATPTAPVTASPPSATSTPVTSSAASSDAGDDTPAGVIATLAIVVAGAAGVGAWKLRRGSRH